MQKLKRFLVTFIATAAGSGFTPKAPGTAGSVVGLVLIYLIRDWSFPLQGLLWLVILFAGWWASLHWSRAVQCSDSQKIVVDEVLGYMLAMWTFPRTGTILIFQFITFRIFDALKPPPIRQLDRMGKNLPIGPAQSFMVIFDDLLAGLLSIAVLWVLIRYFPEYFVF